MSVGVKLSDEEIVKKLSETFTQEELSIYAGNLGLLKDQGTGFHRATGLHTVLGKEISRKCNIPVETKQLGQFFNDAVPLLKKWANAQYRLLGPHDENPDKRSHPPQGQKLEDAQREKSDLMESEEMREFKKKYFSSEPPDTILNLIMPSCEAYLVKQQQKGVPREKAINEFLNSVGFSLISGRIHELEKTDVVRVSAMLKGFDKTGKVNPGDPNSETYGTGMSLKFMLGELMVEHWGKAIIQRLDEKQKNEQKDEKKTEEVTARVDSAIENYKKEAIQNSIEKTYNDSKQQGEYYPFHDAVLKAEKLTGDELVKAMKDLINAYVKGNVEGVTRLNLDGSGGGDQVNRIGKELKKINLESLKPEDCAAVLKRCKDLDRAYKAYLKYSMDPLAKAVIYAENPLHAYVENYSQFTGSPEGKEKLLAAILKHVDINAKNKDGLTALEHAKNNFSGDTKLIEALEKASKPAVKAPSAESSPQESKKSPRTIRSFFSRSPSQGSDSPPKSPRSESPSGEETDSPPKSPRSPRTLRGSPTKSEETESPPKSPLHLGGIAAKLGFRPLSSRPSEQPPVDARSKGKVAQLTGEAIHEKPTPKVEKTMPPVATTQPDPGSPGRLRSDRKDIPEPRQMTDQEKRREKALASSPPRKALPQPSDVVQQPPHTFTPGFSGNPLALASSSKNHVQQNLSFGQEWSNYILNVDIKDFTWKEKIRMNDLKSLVNGMNEEKDDKNQFINKFQFEGRLSEVWRSDAKRVFEILDAIKEGKTPKEMLAQRQQSEPERPHAKGPH
ncbi:MAG: hypothetical protein JSR17_05185 [Proteobacteria bacterium]|nr:hypothetical protein [Pseudomonadota bacterium]